MRKSRISRAVIAVVLALGVSLSPQWSYADPAADKKKAETALAQAQKDLDQATRTLSSAQKRVAQTATEVSRAQVALDHADQEFRQAQSVSEEKQVALQAATQALSLAEVKQAAGQVKVDAQRSQVAAYARAIYQDNLPMVSVVTLLGASNTSELANRVQWTQTILVSNQVDLDNLSEILAELTQARQECEEARQLAEEAKTQADLHTQATEESRQAAAAAHTQLMAALDAQVAAERTAESALATQKNLLAQRKQELNNLSPSTPGQPAPSPTPSPAPKPSPSPTPPPPPVTSQAQKVVDFAKSKVGGPYVWGGEGPKGYDCSGLSKMAYAQVGIKLPHDATAQYRYGKAVAKANLQPGDLVFYYSGPSHVAIYVGSGKVVHARNSALGIQMTSVDVAPYLGARRLL
ncbi:MAG: NlpC/P60 family protein [Propionibacteriaceae bacterium]|nr:NlpC/P60 family protein [Propionibacteriaceae bacterium]